MILEFDFYIIGYYLQFDFCYLFFFKIITALLLIYFQFNFE